MVQLNRSMMDRYEIPHRRPQTTRAMIIAADKGDLAAAAARLLDLANEGGADLGAVIVSRKREALLAQDGMFTLLVRGEDMHEKQVREERVVQSILDVLDGGDVPALVSQALHAQLELIFCPARAGETEQALVLDVLAARWKAGLCAPTLLLMDDCAAPSAGEELRSSLCTLAGRLGEGESLRAWLAQVPMQNVLVESLNGVPSAAEAARIQQQMNYRDDFLRWAEPQLRFSFEGTVPARLQHICPEKDYTAACAKKARIFDAAVFLCAAAGYLCGKNTFAEALKDETLRAWIGHSFFDEILPCLPFAKEEVAPDVISAFERLENPLNDMPLLEIGRNMLLRFGETLLPTIRSYADRAMEAPKGLAFGLSAAIMLYSGARINDGGEYEVLRGEESAVLHDDEEILESFSRFSHDMPAETLAYAALADRSIWGCDLRDIDGLEMRVAYDLSAIQRIGFMETLRLKTLEWDD